MADQTLSALRELTNAVVDEFFGNDTNLSKRLIAATSEAQLLLIVQPPDDDLTNHPAPVEPGQVERLPDGKPYPTPPAEGEAGEVVTWMRSLIGESVWLGDDVEDGRKLTRAAALLQEQAAELAMLRQMAVPVPVDERPWENKPGWLDPNGECWWCPPDGPAYWSMANPAMVYGGWLLPAHAIPVPPENRHHV